MHFYYAIHQNWHIDYNLQHTQVSRVFYTQYAIMCQYLIIVVLNKLTELKIMLKCVYLILNITLNKLEVSLFIKSNI